MAEASGEGDPTGGASATKDSGEAASAAVEGHPSPAGGPTVAGNDSALTTFTPINHWGFYLPGLLEAVQRTGVTLPPLKQLSFINFAQWSIVKRFPQNGPPQGPDPHPQHQMIFESNFNGTWTQYLDAFAEVMTQNFKVFWGTSAGFPGPLPTPEFHRWIQAHESEAGHYYCAYPTGTSTTIGSALELQAALVGFARDSAGMDAAGFQKAYNDLLFQIQRDL